MAGGPSWRATTIAAAAVTITAAAEVGANDPVVEVLPALTTQSGELVVNREAHRGSDQGVSDG